MLVYYGYIYFFLEKVFDLVCFNNNKFIYFVLLLGKGKIYKGYMKDKQYLIMGVVEELVFRGDWRLNFEEFQKKECYNLKYIKCVLFLNGVVNFFQQLEGIIWVFFL